MRARLKWKRVNDTLYVSNTGSLMRLSHDREPGIWPGTFEALRTVKSGKQAGKVNGGYWRVSVEGEIYMVRVQNLVAEYFMPNPDPSFFKIVDHIDGNRSNNHVCNLRWSNNVLNALNKANVKGYRAAGKKFRVYLNFYGKHISRTVDNEIVAGLLGKKWRRIALENIEKLRITAEEKEMIDDLADYIRNVEL